LTHSNTRIGEKLAGVLVNIGSRIRSLLTIGASAPQEHGGRLDAPAS
jgi:hypothetical protein